MWLKVDDRFLEHPKVLAAALLVGGGKRGLGRIASVWLELALYCSRNPTNGKVGAGRLATIMVDPNPKDILDALVDAGLMHREADGLRFHDWTDWQPSAEELSSKQDADRKHKKLHGAPGLVESIRQRDRDRCRYCGRPVNFKDRRGDAGGTYDYVDPKGPCSYANVVVCCLRCRNPKNGKTLEQAGMTLRSEPADQVLNQAASLVSTRSDLGTSQFDHVRNLQYPGPARPGPISTDQEPRGLRRARPARMTIGDVRSHLQAAVHALIEMGPPYVDADGRPNPGELVATLKDIAAGGLKASWEFSRELDTIVSGVIGERDWRRSGQRPVRTPSTQQLLARRVAQNRRLS